MTRNGVEIEAVRERERDRAECKAEPSCDLFFVELGQRSLSFGEVTEFLAIPLGWMMTFIAVMCWATALAAITLGVYRAIVEFREPPPLVPRT